MLWLGLAGQRRGGSAGSLTKLPPGAGSWLCPSLASCFAHASVMGTTCGMEAGRCTATCKIIAPAKARQHKAGGREVKGVLKIRSVPRPKGTIHCGAERFLARLATLPTCMEPILNFILISKSRGKKRGKEKKGSALTGTQGSLAGGSGNVCPLGCWDQVQQTRAAAEVA